MIESIFLSAGVPDPARGPEYARTADTVAIGAAVSALVHVVLGRRLLVWGGHPAVTPMIWAVAEAVNVDYGRWVRLYQTLHFRDEFPEENARFQNVTYTENVGHDRDRSLLLMRERMLTEHTFQAAVFIGGMRGILDEFELFRRLQPSAAVLPVVSTGGAVLELRSRVPELKADLIDDLDYVGLFHRHLAIPVQERRYHSPEEQPADKNERLEKRSNQAQS